MNTFHVCGGHRRRQEGVGRLQRRLLLLQGGEVKSDADRDPNAHVRHNSKEDSTQRILIVMCIIAALIMAAFKPARGATTGAEQCAAAKIAATGKYSLCRMQAEAQAEKTGEQVDFSKCAAQHTRAFTKTEATALWMVAA